MTGRVRKRKDIRRKKGTKGRKMYKFENTDWRAEIKWQIKRKNKEGKRERIVGGIIEIKIEGERKWKMKKIMWKMERKTEINWERDAKEKKVQKKEKAK